MSAPKKFTPKPGPRPFEPRTNRFSPRRREQEHRTNEMITAPEVRVVGENIEPGVYSLEKAMEMAKAEGVDLIEVSPNAVPPVCRIADYKKFLYEQKKKKKEIKANTVKTVVKEIRFGPNTDEHDVDFKVKHAEKFLEDGFKVRAYVFYRGRSIIYKERGELLLLQFSQRLEHLGKVEMMPKLEGKKMFMLLAPKGKK